MAKKKRRRKASLLTKAINVGVLALAFAKPIEILIGGGNISQKANNIVLHATAGVAGEGGGGFDMGMATSFYGPMVAAIVLKKAISMVRRTARV